MTPHPAFEFADHVVSYGCIPVWQDHVVWGIAFLTPPYFSKTSGFLVVAPKVGYEFSQCSLFILIFLEKRINAPVFLSSLLFHFGKVQ